MLSADTQKLFEESRRELISIDLRRREIVDLLNKTIYGLDIKDDYDAQQEVTDLLWAVRDSTDIAATESYYATEEQHFWIPSSDYC